MFCKHCGKENVAGSNHCAYCGNPLADSPTTYNGVPKEVKGWSWGAFMFNIWWGIGHKCYITLLMLIPLVNIVMPFVCGAKGHEWAWKTGNWSSVAEFKKAQESWNRAGFVWFIVILIIIAIYILLGAAFIAALANLY